MGRRGSYACTLFEVTTRKFFWFFSSTARRNVNRGCLILKGALFRVLFGHSVLIAVDKIGFQSYQVTSVGCEVSVIERGATDAFFV